MPCLCIIVFHPLVPYPWTCAPKSPKLLRTSIATVPTRSFVHVFFKEIPEGADSGYDTPHYIDAGNRAGRPAEVVLKLKNDLRQAYAENAGVSLDQVGARIVEGPARWSMEGGHILPEPGQEGAEWYAHAAD